jgi:hypothetical protein
MRNLWNTERSERIDSQNKSGITNPIKLSSIGIKRLMERALWTQNLRIKNDVKSKRYAFQTDHGFRKFFKTRCEIGGMKPINIEKLMGHSVGISDSYYRATEMELLEDYKKVILQVTINKESKLKEKISIIQQDRLTNELQLNNSIIEKNRELVLVKEDNAIKTDAISGLSDQIFKLISEMEKIKITLKANGKY